MRYGLELLQVEKPGRYEGLEAGAVVKPWEGVRLRTVLCFPDVYEIGMSHLGLPILYRVLNAAEDLLAERCYAPWPDMEQLLRRRGWPLVSRESGRALAEFDLVGFTLQYELCATNVLAMLDLGGIPLLAAERGEDDPLVIAGGPVAMNPEPFADFFDALVLGEGEAVVAEVAQTLAAARAAGRPRHERLASLGRVAGVYLPGQRTPRYAGARFAGFTGGAAVRRRVVADLDRAPVADPPLVPFIAPVHERLAVEVARGCTRGCRFCQAGYLYRPVRERTPDTVQGVVRRGLCDTGHDEVGLLSLSTGDYTSVGPLLVALMDEHASRHVSVSLPSLRVDSLEPRLLDEVRRVRKTGFTVAPEAGTARLRAVINKNIEEHEILTAAERIFAAGWKGLKLYFMIGLPTETREDWQGIVDLVGQVARLAPRGRGRISVSISNFVPKPHTPFQWCRMLGPAQIVEAQQFFKAALRDRRVELKWHDAGMSALEGVITRGDRRVGQVILEAYRAGCRMDGWTGEFRWPAWEAALAAAGVDLDQALGSRALDEPLPWDQVDSGVSRDFLAQEWQRAQTGTSTPDCRGGDCQGCGLCDFQALAPTLGPHLEFPPCGGLAEVGTEAPADPSQAPRLRLRFTKLGPASLLSHLETVASLHRALRAAAVELVYSQGFHPHPKLTLGPALPLGTESCAELAELRVWQVPPLAATVTRLNCHLPEGLRVDAMWTTALGSRGLSGGGTRETYALTPAPAAAAAAARVGGWAAVLERFWEAAELQVVKRRRNKPDRVLDAKQYVEGMWLEDDRVMVRVQRGADGSTVGCEDLLRTLLELPEGERACARLLKIRNEFSAAEG